MRILVGGLHHESSTLNPIIIGEDDFLTHYGEDMLAGGLPPSHTTTGIINTLRENGCEIVPTLIARAVPNGQVSKEFYLHLKNKMAAAIRAGLEAGPIDGVCLGLHGSMKIEGLGCAEEDALAMVRELLPGVPIVAAMDMHATITPRLLQYGDGFVGYKTAPHVDSFETGVLAVQMLLKSIKTGKKLYSAYCRIPVILAGEKSETTEEPMRSLMEELRKTEKIPGIEAASYFIAYAWSDTEHISVYSLVTCLTDRETAVNKAKELAALFWARRHDFKFRNENYDAAQSIQNAYEAVLKKHEHPVFVSDSGDNPTAGSTGDATELLERILETMETADKLPTPLLYSGFYDASAAKACVKAGIGVELDLTIGGNWDTINGKKIPLKVKVEKIAQSYGPFSSDLVLVSHKNLRLVITSRHIGFGDPNLLPALMVKPEEYCLVAVKLGYLEPCFRKIAGRAIMATTRGCSNQLFETIPFRNIIRPLFPIDKDMDFSPY